jgi:hypothetical protein
VQYLFLDGEDALLRHGRGSVFFGVLTSPCCTTKKLVVLTLHTVRSLMSTLGLGRLSRRCDASDRRLDFKLRSDHKGIKTTTADALLKHGRGSVFFGVLTSPCCTTKKLVVLTLHTVRSLMSTLGLGRLSRRCDASDRRLDFKLRSDYKGIKTTTAGDERYTILLNAVSVFGMRRCTANCKFSAHADTHSHWGEAYKVNSCARCNLPLIGSCSGCHFGRKKRRRICVRGVFVRCSLVCCLLVCYSLRSM